VSAVARRVADNVPQQPRMVWRVRNSLQPPALKRKRSTSTAQDGAWRMALRRALIGAGQSAEGRNVSPSACAITGE